MLPGETALMSQGFNTTNNIPVYTAHVSCLSVCVGGGGLGVCSVRTLEIITPDY